MARKAPPSNPISNVLSGQQRLNKLLAAAGLGARRQVDELIEQGRVEVDGVIVDQVGMKVDADTAKISVDGTALKKIKPVYFALNKPAGILCTNRDPQGRARVIDLIPGHERLFPVGRLDRSSVGLIILTNDGELTQQLTHPKHGVPKTYFVVVAGQMESDQIGRLRRGIYLSDGIARVDFVKVRKIRKGATELEITLSEGKNREIRRILARLGHKVVVLRRLSIGPLKMGLLPEGAYRPLTREEVLALYGAVDAAKRARRNRRDKADAQLDAGAEKPSKPVAASSSKPTKSISKPIPIVDEDESDDDIEMDETEVETVVEKKPKPKRTERTAHAAKDASKAKEAEQKKAQRDPFAWDDDELLLASPFGKNHISEFSDEAEDDDGEWVKARLKANSDDDDFDGDDLPAGVGNDAMLIDDRDFVRPGGVIDYDDEGSSSDRSGGRSRGGQAGGGRAKKAKFSKDTASSDTRTTRKKAFRSGSETGRPYAKKGGFKKGFKKGGSRFSRSDSGGAGKRSSRSESIEGRDSRTPSTGSTSFRTGKKSSGGKRSSFKSGGVKRAGAKRVGRRSDASAGSSQTRSRQGKGTGGKPKGKSPRNRK